MNEANDHYKVWDDNGVLVELNLFSNDGNGVKSYLISDKSEESLGKMGYEISGPTFKKWLKKWKLHYYARPEDNFSTEEAFREAHQKGFRGVVLESMS